MTGHQGGLHPQGGYRTADLPQDKTKKAPVGKVEKVVVSIVGLPVLVMVVVGLVTLAIKFTQICLAWIS